MFLGQQIGTYAPSAHGNHFDTTLAVAQACERAGRAYDEITRSNHVFILIARDETELAAKKERFGRRLPGFHGLIGTPEMIIAGLQEYAAAGSQYVTFSMPHAQDIEPILLLGEEVLPVVARL